MADIFKITQMDARLEIGGVEYKIHDPNYMTKNALSKEAWEFEKSKATLDPAQQMEGTRKTNLGMVKAYIPDLPEEVLNSMGTGALTSLMNHLIKLSLDNFGAIVEKVEKKP